MNIGRNIAKIREQKNISRRELAQKTGVPYQTLNNIEAGRVKEPGINSLIKIAGVLGVTLDQLIQSKAASKDIKITITKDCCKALQSKELKKLLELLQHLDIKGIKQLKKSAQELRKIIGQVRI